MDEAQSSGLRYLVRMQNADGGWGYHSGGASYVEPTAAVLIAHSLLGSLAPESAWTWLRTAQRSDGFWGYDHSGSAPSWMSAWAVWALAGTGKDVVAVDAGALWLLGVPVMQAADAETMTAMRQLLDLDASLTGWPWQPGEAAWVLPTALTVLAAGAAGYGHHALVYEGEKYLLDRKCSSGGWNWGNPVMLGRSLPATVPETALALLALRARELPPDHAAVRAGLGYLETPLQDLSGGSESAWRLLGLRAWDKSIPGLLEGLVSKQQMAGGWSDNPFVTALALIATAPSAFKLWGRP